MKTKSNIFSRLTALFLLTALLLSLAACGGAPAEPEQTDPASQALADTAKILQETVTEPQPGSIGGEWAVIGLARWTGSTPQEWFDGYYSRLVQSVRACGGVLDERKYTEYSRAILALTAIGADPANVGGFDLLMPLADFDATLFQGLNGPIFALLALKSGGYTLPRNPAAATQATEEMYLSYLLEQQAEDGSWGLTPGSSGSADITAMALQALAQFRETPGVQEAADRGLAFLAQQQPEGCEGYAQVLTALCELGVSAEDERFTTEEGTLVQRLLTYYRPGQGFVHDTEEQEMNLMATEQAFYALVSLDRVRQGKPALYAMSDVGEQDQYLTDPVPAGKPAPVEPQDVTAEGEGGTCTLSISCAVLVNNKDKLKADKRELVPDDGWVLKPTEVTFQPGDSVFDVLLRECRRNKIHMEFVETPMYNSAYIEGIANLYEFDGGDLSGWQYKVNDWFPNYGCSRYAVQEGDVIEWQYTCDLGRDIGGSYGLEG